MNSYEIMIIPDAEADLLNLHDYIANALLAPKTALSYLRMLRKEMETLSIMPGRNKFVEEEPWHSRGLRTTIAKNFYIYYRIEEATQKVYILNVIYAK